MIICFLGECRLKNNYAHEVNEKERRDLELGLLLNDYREAVLFNVPAKVAVAAKAICQMPAPAGRDAGLPCGNCELCLLCIVAGLALRSIL
jgi:hypothetical protein